MTPPLPSPPITASVSFGHQCLLPLFPKLESLYPKLSIELVLTDAVVDLIEERIDLAVRLGPPSDSGLIGVELFETVYRVCASPEYLSRTEPITHPNQLSVRDCLLFPFRRYRSCWRFRETGMSDIVEVPVRGKFVISSALSLRHAARDGLGPVLLPNWMVDEDIAHGRLVRLFPEYEVTAENFNTRAWLLYPSRDYVPLKTRVVIEFLKAHFKPLK